MNFDLLGRCIFSKTKLMLIKTLIFSILSIYSVCSVHKERYVVIAVNADNQGKEGCSPEVKLHSVLSPLCSLSSLGPHDQSLFLLTELQTAWNQDEIGLQTEVKLSISSFPPLSLFPPPPSPSRLFKKRMSPSMSCSPSAKPQSDYFWLSSPVT